MESSYLNQIAPPACADHVHVLFVLLFCLAWAVVTLAVVPPPVLGENAKRQQQSIREIAQRRLLSARDARKGEREMREAGSRASTANIHLMNARRKEGKVPGFAENLPVI